MRKNRAIKSIKSSPKRELKKKEKIIDSISDDEDELEINIDISSKYIIYPNSNFRLLWEIIIDLIMGYLLISIPLGICYGNDEYMKIIDFFSEIMFITDVIINFFVAYYNYDESLVLNHSLIFYNYFLGWFIVDFISAIPTCFIINNYSHYKHFSIKNNICFSDALMLSLTLLKFIKLLKLFSQNQLKNKFYQEVFEKSFHFQSGEERVMSFFIWFMIASHNLACVWIFVGKLDNSNWFMYLKEDDSIDIYLASLYFNWTTIFTIGYGDILSVSIYERVYNIFLMTFGVCIYSFAVTSLSNLIISQDSHTKKFTSYLGIIEDIREKYPNIPLPLTQSLIKFVRYDYKSNKSEKYSFIWDLPNKIRNILIIKMFQNFLKNFSFFRNIKINKSDDFDTKILLYMKPVKIPKGEFLIKQNSRVEELIFINQGILSVELGEENESKRLFKLRKYDHFGDLFVLTNKRCPVNIRVRSKYCEILIIKKNDLLDIAKDYPDTINEILKTSVKNYKRMKSRIRKIIQKQDLIRRDKLKLYDKTISNLALEIQNKNEKKEEKNESYSNLRIITEINESEDSEENNNFNISSNIRLLENKGLNEIQKELMSKVNDKKEEQKMILSNENSEELFLDNVSTQDINYIAKNMTDKEIRCLINRKINSSSKINNSNSNKDMSNNFSPLNNKKDGDIILKHNCTLSDNNRKTKFKPMSLFFESLQKQGNGIKINKNENLVCRQQPMIELFGVKKTEMKETINHHILNNNTNNSNSARNSFKRNSDGNINIKDRFKGRGSISLGKQCSRTLIMKNKEKTQISLFVRNKENSSNIALSQDITSHMKETSDPNSFMLKEICKLEKKLLIDKKKELQEYNKKLDYIFCLLQCTKK